MRTLLRFVVRDFKDTAVMWILVGVVTGVGLAVRSTRSLWFGLGYAYFFFFLIYLSQVWNGPWGRAISREYILSLPISRTRMFWFMWLRSLVGMMPLLALFGLQRADVKLFMSAVRDGLLLPAPIGDLEYLAALTGAVWMWLTIFASAQDNQTALLMAKRQRRYLPWLKYFAWLAVDFAFFALWILAFCGPQKLPLSLAMAAACLGYYSLKTRVAYVKWLWGSDARVFRRRTG